MGRRFFPKTIKNERGNRKQANSGRRDKVFNSLEQRLRVAGTVVADDFFREAIVNGGDVVVQVGPRVGFDLLHFLQAAACDEDAARFAVVWEDLREQKNLGSTARVLEWLEVFRVEKTLWTFENLALWWGLTANCYNGKQSNKRISKNQLLWRLSQRTCANVGRCTSTDTKINQKGLKMEIRVPITTKNKTSFRNFVSNFKNEISKNSIHCCR